MTSTPSLALSRRDAAIAAALTGTVVVVLGYASGLGLTVETPSAAQPPLPPAPPAAVAPTTPPVTMPMEPTMPPMATMPAMPVMPPMDNMPMPTEPTEPPATDPTEPPPTEPGPVAEAPTKCPPALLEQLPVVGPVTQPVGSLLSSLLGSLPLLGELAGPSADGAPGTLGCALGTVLGPQCCETEATVPTRIAP